MLINSLVNKDIYETFDYAEFLKNNEKFNESIISLYTRSLMNVEKRPSLYTQKQLKVEELLMNKVNDWNKAEKDLLASLRSQIQSRLM